MALTGQSPRHSSQDVHPRSMMYFFFIVVMLQLILLLNEFSLVGLLYVGKCFPQGLEVDKNLMYIAEYLIF